jgi:1,4-alpha-glucan branching enzyme
MEKGYLNYVLHAHLPFVRHPEYDDSFEERWLYEAITETYIPLLHMFNELREKNVYFRMTMSITPPLMEMLADDLLQKRYVRHLEKLQELIEREKFRTRNDPAFHPLALMYERKFKAAHEIFVDRYKMNLLTAFREVQEAGYIEIMTCCATHGFLPLMCIHPEAVKAQISIAVKNYRKHMGRDPRGIWLAECGYFPGADIVLKNHGIRFFFVDSHGLILATPRPKYALYSAVICPSGVAAFARDPESSKQVWSSKEGYPGDFDYREFYRDVGYDLPIDYIAPYIHESGIRINTGVKYHRITGPTDQKKPYVEAAALAKTRSHARHFVSCRTAQSEYLRDVMGRLPVITCPYDAELYGHWWYEGPDFLKAVFESIAADNYGIKPVTPLEYLQIYPDNPVATPSLSSWGHKGYSEYWLEECNDWIYRHLHKAAERMISIATSHRSATDTITVRALNQAARELLLAQSSDWAFIIKTATCVEYAEKRTKDHICSFTRLYEEIQRNDISLKFLEALENKNNIFQEIDFRIYAQE